MSARQCDSDSSLTCRVVFVCQSGVDGAGSRGANLVERTEGCAGELVRICGRSHNLNRERQCGICIESKVERIVHANRLAGRNGGEIYGEMCTVSFRLPSLLILPAPKVLLRIGKGFAGIEPYPSPGHFELAHSCLMYEVLDGSYLIQDVLKTCKLPL